jgi:PleD family two-component response regulator
MAVLDELRAFLAESPARYGESRSPLRINIGVCCVVPNEGDTTASLLAMADAALYEAKGLGRNTLQLALRLPLHGDDYHYGNSPTLNG